MTQMVLWFLVGGSPRPFVSYHWKGGLSPYGEVVIKITQSGEVHVQSEKRQHEVENYDTDLSAEELEGLRMLVRSTDFLSQPERDSQFATDMGETDLTVSLDGRTKNLKFGYRPTLDPLLSFLRRLHGQAEVFHVLTKSGDVYSALSAHILQPYRLKRPWITYFQKQTEYQKVQWALHALAAVMTPEEFAGVVATEMREKGKIALPMPPYDFPDAHAQAICPVYLLYLKENFPSLAEFEKGADGQDEQIVKFLGEYKYTQAIPFFMKWFAEDNKRYAEFALSPIANMGMDGIHTLSALLDDPKDAHRESAMEVLANAAADSHREFPNAVLEWEYNQIKNLFEQSVLPKLTHLAASDTSEPVRKKAAETIKKIKSKL